MNSSLHSYNSALLHWQLEPQKLGTPLDQILDSHLIAGGQITGTPVTMIFLRCLGKLLQVIFLISRDQSYNGQLPGLRTWCWTCYIDTVTLTTQHPSSYRSVHWFLNRRLSDFLVFFPVLAMIPPLGCPIIYTVFFRNAILSNNA